MVVILSCSKKPLADFDFEVNEGQTYTFINKSEDGENFLWNFGDGTTSSQRNPVHTYNDTGKYQVVLTAKDGSSFNSVVKNLAVIIDPQSLKDGNSMSCSFSSPAIKFASDSTYFRTDFNKGYITGHMSLYGWKAVVSLTLPKNPTLGSINVSDDYPVSRWTGQKEIFYRSSNITSGQINVERMVGDTIWGSFYVYSASNEGDIINGKFKVNYR